jgi:meso-butanediol dehydrogenase/(S,S)-butanediol dehydrogenase/diacetyl reductase
MKELVALITGAASGIGRATAHKLASRGISIVLADMNRDQGTAAADEISQKWKVRTKFLKLDVTKENEVKDAVAAAASLNGRLDFAANCAGICESIWDEEESVTAELFERYDSADVLRLPAITKCLY